MQISKMYQWKTSTIVVVLQPWTTSFSPTSDNNRRRLHFSRNAISVPTCPNFRLLLKVKDASAKARVFGFKGRTNEVIWVNFSSTCMKNRLHTAKCVFLSLKNRPVSLGTSAFHYRLCLAVSCSRNVLININRTAIMLRNYWLCRQQPKD